jgi:hypothetical protein
MIKKFTPVYLFSFLFLSSQALFGQFKDATIMSYSYGITPVNSVNIGNDIMDFGGLTYEVAVTDDPNGNNCFLGWKVGNITGTVAVGQGFAVEDPDVCILKNTGGGVYALVAYFNSTTNEFMIQSFSWSSGSQQFIASTPVFLATGNYYKAINIDSDDNGTFAIVWDEPGNLIHLAFGQALGGQGPILSLNGISFILDPGSEPDVCVFREAASNFVQFDVVFKNAANYIVVDTYKLNDLLTSSLVPTHLYRSAPADLNYSKPRIDCPGSSFGNKEDFTVVMEDSDNNSTWYIKGINSNYTGNLNFTYKIYNDGNTGFSPFDITSVPNTNPVVAYDNSGLTIWVSWEIDNSWGLLTAPGAFLTRFPVAVSCNKGAAIFPNSKYLVIPETANNNAAFKNISIAGKKSSSALLSYNDINNAELLSKTVSHYPNTQSLKSIFNDHNFYNWITQPSTINEKQIVIELINMSGQVVYHFAGDSSTILEKVKLLNTRFNTGLYIIKAYSGSSYYSGKLQFTNL